LPRIVFALAIAFLVFILARPTMSRKQLFLAIAALAVAVLAIAAWIPGNFEFH